jgi:hypothetical protein
LPANVALKDAFNDFTALNYFRNRLIIFGGVAGTDYSTAPIEIQKVNIPRISFHWPGVVASQIGMDSSGVIRTYDNPGTGYERFAAANITAYGTLTGNNVMAGGNIHNTAGYVFPGQITNGGGYQGSWYLASHPSYGLYTNTGLYSASNIWAAGALVPGQGVIFPPAQYSHSDGNTLDDYEEGAWTPTLTSSGGGSSGYSIRYGKYTKIGNVVNFTFHIEISGYAFNEGYIYIDLPFVVDGSNSCVLSVSYYRTNASIAWFGGYIEAGTARSHFQVSTPGGSATQVMYMGNFGPSGMMLGGGSYRTAT